MSEWIKCSDKMPMHGVDCWIYGSVCEPPEKEVFQGRFDLMSRDYRNRKLTLGPGWEYDTHMSDYAMADQVSHWMPYSTPEPPNDL